MTLTVAGVCLTFIRALDQGMLIENGKTGGVKQEEEWLKGTCLSSYEVNGKQRRMEGYITRESPSRRWCGGAMVCVCVSLQRCVCVRDLSGHLLQFQNYTSGTSFGKQTLWSGNTHRCTLMFELLQVALFDCQQWWALLFMLNTELQFCLFQLSAVKAARKIKRISFSSY